MGKPKKNKGKAKASAEAAAAAAAAPASTSNSTPVSAKKKIKKRQQKKKIRIPEAEAATVPAVKEEKKKKEVMEEGKEKEAKAAKEERKEARSVKEEKSSGFIFMCNSRTKPECYRNQVFGLPRGKEEMVDRIKPGARLFLYDFDVKLLYGVYRATSEGGKNLVPTAFGGAFPCQVKFKIDQDCLPLPESSFKQAILENYDAKHRFKPDLNSKQVHKLLSMFQPISSAPQGAGRQYIEDKRPPAQLPPPADPYRQGVYQAPAHLPPPEDLYRSRGHLPRAHMPPPEDPYRSRGHLAPTHIPHPEDPYRSRGHYAPANMPPLEDPYRPAGHMLPPEDPYRSRAYQAPVHMPPPEDPYRPGGRTVPSHLPPANDSYRSERYLLHQLPPEDPYSLRYLAPTPLEARYLSQLAPQPASDSYVPRYVGATATGPPTTDPYYTAPASDPYSQLDVARFQPENPAPSDRLAYRMAHEITRADDPYRTAEIPAMTNEVQPLQSYYLRAYEDPNRPYAESIQRQAPSTAPVSATAPVSSLYSFAGPAPAYR